MASTPGNKRPNPAQEQRDALNRAVNRGAVTSPGTIPAAPSSLDTFNITRVPSAAEAAAAAVALDGEDDGLNEVGESDQNNGGAQDLNNNESDLANEKASELWESVVADEGEDESGYGDDSETGSPFDFVNPGKERLAQHMEDIFPEEDQQSGGGTAAGRTVPTTSVGGSPFGNTGGTGAYGATDPFTGQGMGFNAYGTPGIPGVGAGGSKGGANDPLFGLMSARVGEMSGGSTSPSVADGGSSDPLAAAIAHAKTPEGQAEAAQKAGVTPSGGDAAAPAPAPADTDDDSDSDSDEPGIVDRFVAWVKEQTTSTGPSRTEQEVPEEVGIGGAQTTNADALKAVGVNNLETAMSDSLGAFANHQKTKGGGVKDPGPDGEELGGPPTEAEMAFRAYIHQQLNYHGSPGHNEGDSTPTPEGNAVGTGSVSITQHRDMGRALFGQPAEDGPSMRGGTPTPGFLPGDRGDVDPGEDSDTGAWTSNSQTEQPEDALEGFGGSGLSISDARRNADEDEEDDDDQDV